MIDKNYRTWEIVNSQNYDSDFSKIGNRTYEKEELLETTLERYDSDCVHIPNGKLYFSARVPFKMSKCIKNGIIYRNHSEILYGLASNYLLLNPGRPQEWVLDYLLYLNKYHTSEYFSYDELIGISETVVQDINVVLPYNSLVKEWWIDPKCKDKRKAYENRLKNWDGLSNEAIINNLPDKKISMKELSSLSCYSSEITFRNSLTKDQKEIIKSHNSKYNSSKKRIIKR